MSTNVQYPMRTIATADVGGSARAIIVRSQSDAGAQGWVTVYPDGSYDFNPDGHVGAHQSIRRLVVLDLDDRLRDDLDRVARVQEPVFDSISESVWGRVFSQIRAQTQPGEPAGFGARVLAVVPHPRRSGVIRRLVRLGDGYWYANEGQRFIWSELSDVTLGWDDEGSGT